MLIVELPRASENAAPLLQASADSAKKLDDRNVLRLGSELARVGARVILACRNTAKGDAAADGMTGDVEVRPLDLQLQMRAACLARPRWPQQSGT